MEKISYYNGEYEIEFKGKSYILEIWAGGFLRSESGDYMNPPDQFIIGLDCGIDSIQLLENGGIMDIEDITLKDELLEYIDFETLLEEQGA